jgi:hypothetical protein
MSPVFAADGRARPCHATGATTGVPPTDVCPPCLLTDDPEADWDLSSLTPEPRAQNTPPRVRGTGFGATVRVTFPWLTRRAPAQGGGCSRDRPQYVICGSAAHPNAGFVANGDD